MNLRDELYIMMREEETNQELVDNLVGYKIAKYLFTLLPFLFVMVLSYFWPTDAHLLVTIFFMGLQAIFVFIGVVIYYMFGIMINIIEEIKEQNNDM